MHPGPPCYVPLCTAELLRVDRQRGQRGSGRGGCSRAVGGKVRAVWAPPGLWGSRARDFGTRRPPVTPSYF